MHNVPCTRRSSVYVTVRAWCRRCPILIDMNGRVGEGAPTSWLHANTEALHQCST